MGILELVGALRLEVLPVRLRRGLGVVHDEGQLKDLDARESPGRAAANRPDDVDDTVARLVVQLNRSAAQLHGGVALELDAPAGFLLHLLHPRLVHQQPDVGHRGHEGVELQRHGLLCQPGQVRHAQRRRGSALDQGTSLHGGVSYAVQNSVKLTATAHLRGPGLPLVEAGRATTKATEIAIVSSAERFLAIPLLAHPKAGVPRRLQ